eukprot:2888249-Pleurochrysis_carterae.AAC.16
MKNQIFTDRIFSAAEQLRYTNSRYGGAAQRAARPISRGGVRGLLKRLRARATLSNVVRLPGA